MIGGKGAMDFRRATSRTGLVRAFVGRDTMSGGHMMIEEHMMRGGIDANGYYPDGRAVDSVTHMFTMS